MRRCGKYTDTDSSIVYSIHNRESILRMHIYVARLFLVTRRRRPRKNLACEPRVTHTYIIIYYLSTAQQQRTALGQSLSHLLLN